MQPAEAEPAPMVMDQDIPDDAGTVVKETTSTSEGVCLRELH